VSTLDQDWLAVDVGPLPAGPPRGAFALTCSGATAVNTASITETAGTTIATTSGIVTTGRQCTAAIVAGSDGYVVMQVPLEGMHFVSHRDLTRMVDLDKLGVDVYIHAGMPKPEQQSVARRYITRYAIDCGARKTWSQFSGTILNHVTDYLRRTILDDVIVDVALTDPRVDAFNEILGQKIAAAKYLIEEWATEKGANTAVVTRLADLVDAAAEDYPELEIPNRQALTSVFELLRSLKELRTPQFGVASNGGVWAEWRGVEQRATALEFLRDGTVNLAAFFPDPKNPLRSASLTANYSWRSLASFLSETRSLQWLFNK
jgi:hypothetical protein